MNSVSMLSDTGPFDSRVNIATPSNTQTLDCIEERRIHLAVSFHGVHPLAPLYHSTTLPLT